MTHIQNAFRTARLTWLLNRAVTICLLPDDDARESLVEELVADLRGRGWPSTVAATLARFAVAMAREHLRERLALPVA